MAVRGVDAVVARPPRALGALLAAAALAVLVRVYGAAAVLGGIGVLGVGAVLLLRPDTAAPLVVFLLYTNIPVVAHQLHGVPEVFAGTFLFLLAIPIARALLLRRERVRTDPAFRWMLGFLGVLLLSALFAADKAIAAARIRSYVLEGLLLYWLVLNAVRHAPALRRVLWAVLAAGGLMAGLSVYQAATGDYGRDFGGLAQRRTRVELTRGSEPSGAPVPVVRVSERAAGPLGEPNRYAQILIVLLPLCMVPLRRGRTRAVRLCAAGTGLLIVGGVALSFSRGALLALVGLLAAALALRWIRPAHAAAALVGVAGVAFAFAPGLVERVASIGAVTDLVWDRPAVEADGAIRGRATEMLAATYAFLDHPVLGVGPGQYMPVYSVEYHQALPVRFRDLHRPRRAHSLYFEMAAETGIVGLTVFLTIIGVLLRQLWRVRRRWAGRRPEYADLATALTLCIGAYLTTGLFLHLAYERYFWLLLALAAAAIHVMESDDHARV